MSKNTDDILLAFWIGVIIGFIACFIVGIIVNYKHGVDIEKDTKVYVAGNKYRVTSIDDSNRLGTNVSTFTVALNVNKLQ